MSSMVGNNMSKLHSSTALDLLFQNLNDLICYQHLWCSTDCVNRKSQHVKHDDKGPDRVFQLFPCLFFLLLPKYNGFLDAGT